MLVGLVLVFSKEQNLEMIASEIDVRNDFLLIPFLIGYWVYILKKLLLYAFGIMIGKKHMQMN